MREGLDISMWGGIIESMSGRERAHTPYLQHFCMGNYIPTKWLELKKKPTTDYLVIGV